VADKGETPNDRNDRAIRVAAKWYTARLPSKEIILLTSDADNRSKALESGVKAMTMEEYTSSKVKDVAVVDLVAWCGPPMVCRCCGPGASAAPCAHAPCGSILLQEQRARVRLQGSQGTARVWQEAAEAVQRACGLQ
jgi:hypothetical protein